MIGPMSDDKSFIDVPCQSREVVHIECDNLECGRRPAHIKPESVARRYAIDKTHLGIHIYVLNVCVASVAKSIFMLPFQSRG